MIPAALARHLATRRSTTRPTETWTWPAGSVPQLVPQPARDLRLSITAHRQIDDKKPCKMAVYDGWWRTLAIGGGWLRIRRSQVRVLPSALFEFLYLQEFSFVPSREHEASWAFDRGLTVARAQGWLALQRLAMSLVRESLWSDGCLFGRSQKEDSPSLTTAAHEQERGCPGFLCEPLLCKTLRQGGQ